MFHERVGERVEPDLEEGMPGKNQVLGHASFTLEPEAEAALLEAIEEADR